MEVKATAGEFDCHDFLSRLTTPERWGEPAVDFLSPTPEDVKEQLRKSYELVDLAEVPLRASMIATGVSAEFLQLASRGMAAMAAWFKGWASKELAQSVTAPEIPPRVVDALLLLETRKKHSVSPWTAKTVSTSHCLGPNWYLFCDGEDTFIVGQASALPFAAHDTVWILPSVRKLLYVPAGHDTAQILDIVAQAIVQLAMRSEQAFSYLRTDDRQILVSDWDCRHFGHYVWNVLSAWGSFFELAATDRIPTIATHHSREFFGSIKDVFGKAGCTFAEEHIQTSDDLYDLIFRESYLVCCIQANLITESTAASVVNHCMASCGADFAERLYRLKRDRWPIVLLSLRLDNRSWVDQIDGFVDIATRLRNDFPDIGFVVHGISKGVPMGWTTSWMSLQEEILSAGELERRLGGGEDVLSAVGEGIHESAAVANLCDAFLSPLGSGMALFKWLTNKPGVAFSNRFCVDPSNPHRWVYLVFEAYRENMVPSVYVPLSAVTDIGGDRRGTPSRTNFSLDRAAVYRTARDLLHSLLNLALRRPALQSSVSQFSAGKTCEQDARGGNNGDTVIEYGIHTARELDPWWQVDLESECIVQRVVIFNRREQAERLARFTLLGSCDGEDWQVLFRKTDGSVFGRDNEGFSIAIDAAIAVRYLRVRLDGDAPLHFKECQVYGLPADPARRVQMERVQARQIEGL